MKIDVHHCQTTFVVFFSFSFPGFLCHITHSDAYFAFYIEVSVVDLKDLQQLIDAEDNNAVCFGSGVGFGCRVVLEKANENFLGCRDEKKPRLYDD